MEHPVELLHNGDRSWLLYMVSPSIIKDKEPTLPNYRLDLQSFWSIMSGYHNNW